MSPYGHAANVYKETQGGVWIAQHYPHEIRATGNTPTQALEKLDQMLDREKEKSDESRDRSSSLYGR